MASPCLCELHLPAARAARIPEDLRRRGLRVEPQGSVLCVAQSRLIAAADRIRIPRYRDALLALVRRERRN